MRIYDARTCEGRLTRAGFSRSRRFAGEECARVKLNKDEETSDISETAACWGQMLSIVRSDLKKKNKECVWL